MSHLTDHILRTLASVRPSNQILNLGLAHDGLATSLIQLGFSVTGFDADRNYVDALHAELDRLVHTTRVANRPKLYSGDWAPLPFADDQFDWIVATALWERLSSDDLDLTLSECARTIRPGGWMVVAVSEFQPGATGERSSHREMLEERLQDSTFLPAESWRLLSDNSTSAWHAIYRRSGEHTIG